MALTIKIAPTLTAGVYGPVGLMTTMTSDTTSTTKGPVFDNNPVFDAVFVSAAPLKIGIAAAKTAADVKLNKKYPGSAYVVQFTMTFTDALWAKKTILPPYDIVFDLTKPASTDRVQDTTLTTLV